MKISRSNLFNLSLAIIVIASVFLVNISSSGIWPYEPWWDVNADGVIDIQDVARVSGAFGTFGDSTKNVTVAGHANKLAYSISDQYIVEDGSFSRQQHHLELTEDNWPRKFPERDFTDKEEELVYNSLLHDEYRWRKLETLVKITNLSEVRVLENLRSLEQKDLVRRIPFRSIDNRHMWGATANVGCAPHLHKADKASFTVEDIVTSADEVTVQVLGSLFDFIERTRERFYNENRRYQVLARIRKVLREHLFECFPSDSTDRSLVTAIINATNRTTAKKFRVKYLDIFKDSLEVLREGRTDAKTIELLEKRLLEIDDEL